MLTPTDFTVFQFGRKRTMAATPIMAMLAAESSPSSPLSVRQSGTGSSPRIQKLTNSLRKAPGILLNGRPRRRLTERLL